MAKKAGGKTSTARIRYSQALKLAGEYLGNGKDAERLLREGLEAAQIPWQCARFDTPKGYSGPGPGDPKFWKFDHQTVASYLPTPVFLLHSVRIEGDSAHHINGAAAFGIELDHSALVRLNLLPPDDTDSNQVETRSGKRLIEAEVKRRAGAGDRWDSITALSEDLHKWMKAKTDRPLEARTIENYLRDLDLRSLLSKKK